MSTMQGEIVRWCGTFGLIAPANGGGRKRFHFSTRGIKPDWRGSRAWAFDSGIPVRFELTERMDDKSGTWNQVATNVRPVFPMSEPQDLSNYAETSIVARVANGYLFLNRPCGDQLFLHKNDVLESFRHRWSSLVEGAPVYHRVSYDKSKDSWQACDAELFSAEELQNYFSPTEHAAAHGSAAAAGDHDHGNERDLAHQSAVRTVLTPATRNKPLIQIILERNNVRR